VTTNEDNFLEWERIQAGFSFGGEKLRFLASLNCSKVKRFLKDLKIFISLSIYYDLPRLGSWKEYHSKMYWEPIENLEWDATCIFQKINPLQGSQKTYISSPHKGLPSIPILGLKKLSLIKLSLRVEQYNFKVNKELIKQNQIKIKA